MVNSEMRLRIGGIKHEFLRGPRASCARFPWVSSVTNTKLDVESEYAFKIGLALITYRSELVDDGVILHVVKCIWRAAFLIPLE